MQKNFIIDTNVIINDSKCLYNFEDNNVYLPITILEELDNLKTDNGTTGYNAREFIRDLDKLLINGINEDGIPLNSLGGKLFFRSTKGISETVKHVYDNDTVDNRIISLAEDMISNNIENVVIVSMDVNLRVKSKSLGIEAQDYKRCKVSNINTVLRTNAVIEDFDITLLDELFKHGTVSIDNNQYNFINNQYMILKNNNKSVLCYYNSGNINKLEKQTIYGITPKNAEQAFAVNALMRDDIQLLAIDGLPGGGKTLLSIAAALTQKNKFDVIILSRPIIALANKELGFLPGKVKEKTDPYMQPFFDNLGVIKSNYKPASKDFKQIDDMIADGKIVTEPLTYLRGRSISKAFFIIDDSQNLSALEVKTIVTRAGVGTKIIFTGDVQQIDVPYLNVENNGFSHLIDKMKGESLFAHVNLFKSERSYLAELASNKL